MELPVNERLEILLAHFNISQKQLAEMAGISENTISNAKNGKNVPGVDFFNAIFQAFPALSPHWLYLGTGEMFSDGTNVELSSSMRKMKKITVDDCMKIVKACEREIEYLKVQIKDKEEIIELMRSKLNAGG